MGKVLGLVLFGCVLTLIGCSDATSKAEKEIKSGCILVLGYGNKAINY